MHTVVADLGFGDAGKGAVVDRLCRTGEFGAVVRFNGGAQAAHNVVTADGRHHTFAQFGSGTLRGVPGHLSRFVCVDPLALAAEADHLRALGVPDPYGLLSVDRRALLTTPYHAAANRLREQARGADRHGSCGMGVGETARYALDHPQDAPTAGDCTSRPRLLRRLRLLRDRLADELGPLPAPPVEDCADAYAAFARTVALTPEGGRNRALFWASCRMAENNFAPADIASWLVPAAQHAGLGDREIETTINSAVHHATRLGPASRPGPTRASEGLRL